MFPFTITFSKSFKGLLTKEKRDAIITSITELLIDEGASDISANGNKISYEGYRGGFAFSIPGYFQISEDNWTFKIKLRIKFFWIILMTTLISAIAIIVVNVGFGVFTFCFITFGNWIVVMAHKQKFYGLMAGIEEFLNQYAE